MYCKHCGQNTHAHESCPNKKGKPKGARSSSQASQYIQKALSSLGQSSAMTEARTHLQQALKSLQKTQGKRSKRHVWAEKFKEDALQGHNNWMEKIKDNTQKLLDQNLEDLDVNVQRDK